MASPRIDECAGNSGGEELERQDRQSSDLVKSATSVSSLSDLRWSRCSLRSVLRRSRLRFRFRFGDLAAVVESSSGCLTDVGVKLRIWGICMHACILVDLLPRGDWTKQLMDVVSDLDC